ncbi:hypothetical protein R3P38DRAFT_3102750, partial [Favolaschia claudopus]
MYAASAYSFVLSSCDGRHSAPSVSTGSSSSASQTASHLSRHEPGQRCNPQKREHTQCATDTNNACRRGGLSKLREPNTCCRRVGPARRRTGSQRSRLERNDESNEDGVARKNVGARRWLDNLGVCYIDYEGQTRTMGSKSHWQDSQCFVKTTETALSQVRDGSREEPESSDAWSVCDQQLCRAVCTKRQTAGRWGDDTIASLSCIVSDSIERNRRVFSQDQVPEPVVGQSGCIASEIRDASAAYLSCFSTINGRRIQRPG